MQKAFNLMHDQLGPGTVLRLQESICSITRCWNSEIGVGTACSGTDVAIRVVNMLSLMWQARYNLRLTFKHVFSAEIDPTAQAFILAHHKPALLFNDIQALHQGVAFDVMSGESRSVPQADIFIAGFECDSISGLNAASARNRHCVEEAVGRTGETFKGAVAYVRRNRPIMCIWENVKTLAARETSRAASKPEATLSNLEAVIAVMNLEGYHVEHLLEQASNYGAPQSRERYYLLCFRVADSNSGFDSKNYCAMWAAQMSKTTRALRLGCPIPLQEFLDDPEPTPDEPNDDLAAKKAKKGSAFEVDHLEAFNQAGMVWPPNLDEYPEMKAAMTKAKLTQREQELAFYYERMEPLDAESEVEMVHDLNLSMKFGSHAPPGLSPCIACSSLLWMRRRLRPIKGTEALRIQGVGEIDSTFVISNKKLMVFAGNAFNGFTFGAVFIAAMANFPWGEFHVNSDDACEVGH